MCRNWGKRERIGIYVLYFVVKYVLCLPITHTVCILYIQYIYSQNILAGIVPFKPICRNNIIKLVSKVYRIYYSHILINIYLLFIYVISVKLGANSCCVGQSKAPQHIIFYLSLHTRRADTVDFVGALHKKSTVHSKLVFTFLSAIKFDDTIVRFL